MIDGAMAQLRLQGLAGQKKFLLNTDAVDAETLSVFLSSDWLDAYPTAVCVDLAKAVEIYQSLDASAVDTAFMLARVNFMGTDGLRGRVVNKPTDDCIGDFLRDNAFTPELVELMSFAFVQLLLDNHVVTVGETAVIGNDGRDLAYGWAFRDAVRVGFTRAGLDVLDLGVVPTPLVPWQCLKLGHTAAACLTASHNPSNQNGLKFFVDGKKLLSEGNLGDYALSAYMYDYCYKQSQPPEASGQVSTCSVIDDGTEWISQLLGDATKSALSGLTLVFDSANGATDTIGRAVLDRLGAHYVCVNGACTGENINRGVGVAEVEGTERYLGAKYDQHIPTVKQIFDAGRKSPAGTVFGVVVDGDGDRGFVLYYSLADDCVYVLDGDKCGYIMAQYFIDSRKLEPADYRFLCTIESDIMMPVAANQCLGLETNVVSVGDKWISGFPSDDVLVGVEISGHVIFPIDIECVTGQVKTLKSGFGLLTGLMTITAISGLHLDEDKIIEPFAPGFSKTYYTFFVNKSLFYRGSNLWNKDRDLVAGAVSDAIGFSVRPAIECEDKEDPHVLYMKILVEDKLAGVIFVRNSGTEDKNVIYVKGDQAYEDVLVGIGAALQRLQASEMKARNRAEYGYEQAVMACLDLGDGTTTLDKIKTDCPDASETDLFSVLNALRREGRIRVLDQQVTRN